MIQAASFAGPSKFLTSMAQDPTALARDPAARIKALQAADPPGEKDDPKLREAFDSFVGETFYGQLLASLRKMTHKSAYFDGGRAEEVFRGQLDQVLSTEMTKATANTFTDPMFDLFMLNRK